MDFPSYSLKCLIPFSNHPDDGWTVDDAMKGTSIMGGTGSGKSSGSGRHIAIKFLKEGWGGLVLCAKSDEAKQWEEYCTLAGRSDDYVRFGKSSLHQSKPFEGQKMVFNPVDYELTREGEGAGETQNITNIFMNIYRMTNRISGGGDNKEERFWDVALKRCLNRVIELIKLADEILTYRNMVKILQTCDRFNITQFADACKDALKNGPEKYNNDNNYCMYCLVKACLNLLHEPVFSERSIALKMANEYFTHSFPGMGEKTKTTISEMFMGLAEPFLSGFLYSHFAGVTNIFPEQIYGHNRFNPDDKRKLVLVLDFGIKEFLDAGIVAQCVFKLMFQQAIERRNVEKYPTPVFIWCDEAQYFLNPYDQIFLTTARSSRTATVYLSQNISNYFAVMGSEKEGKAKVDSLMGNLSTKIFHANSDAETNEYASRLIGNDLLAPANVSINKDSHLDIITSRSESLNSAMLPQVRPMEFTTLRSGGERNNYKVDSIITVSGREWHSQVYGKRNFTAVTFRQNFKNANNILYEQP